jgi:exodeoxyribonuclease VII small subunit
MAKNLKEDNGNILSFEQSLKRLEEIVHLLEEGELGLNEALERYEEGVKLLRQSYDLLQRAERRIELLSGVDAEGNPITQPFDDSATANIDEKSKRRKSNQ